MRKLRFPLSALLLLVTLVAAILGWRVACVRVVEQLANASAVDDPEAAAALMDRSSREAFHEYWTTRFYFNLTKPPPSRWSAALYGVPPVQLRVRYRQPGASHMIGFDKLEASVRPWGIDGLERVERYDDDAIHTTIVL